MVIENDSLVFWVPESLLVYLVLLDSLNTNYHQITYYKSTFYKN